MQLDLARISVGGCLRERKRAREGEYHVQKNNNLNSTKGFFHHVSPKHYPVVPTPPHPPLSLPTLTPISFILMHLLPILPSYRAGYNSVTSLVETM